MGFGFGDLSSCPTAHVDGRAWGSGCRASVINSLGVSVIVSGLGFFGVGCRVSVTVSGLGFWV